MPPRHQQTPPDFDCYEVLEIEQDASQEDVQAAYRRLAKQWHPDLHPEEDKDIAEEHMKRINIAYEWIKDPKQRAIYNDIRHEQSETNTQNAQFEQFLETLRTLLNAGADPNARDRDGRTPLDAACDANAPAQVLQELIAHGADPKTSDTVLNHALAHFINVTTDKINILLKAGANPNKQDPYNVFPLEMACAHNANIEVLRLLIDHGANPKIASDALNYALAHQYDVTEQKIRLLLEAGADTNTRDIEDKTPLKIACEYNTTPLDVIIALIEYNAKAEESPTLLHTALAHEHSVTVEKIRVLLEAGAPVNTRNQQNETPLEIAFQFNADINVITEMVAHKASAYQTPTLLHKVIEHHKENTLQKIKLLIDADADVNALDEYGRTPLEVACNSDADPEILNELIAHGANPAIAYTSLHRLLGPYKDIPIEEQETQPSQNGTTQTQQPSPSTQT